MPARSPLDLTKVRMQATGDKGMINSLRKTVRTAGVRGLFDGISGTWLRQMTYSICRFWAYDESKKLLGAGASRLACTSRVRRAERMDSRMQTITRPRGCSPRRAAWRAG